MERRNHHQAAKKISLWDCSNYRGIMLLSTPGKVLIRVLLERMKEAIDRGRMNIVGDSSQPVPVPPRTFTLCYKVGHLDDLCLQTWTIWTYSICVKSLAVLCNLVQFSLIKCSVALDSSWQVRVAL